MKFYFKRGGLIRMVALSLVFSAFLLTSHAHAQIAGNGSGTDLKVRIPVSAGWFAFTDRGWEAPAADCYLVSCTVRLSWSADECADTYTLLRADDDGTEMLRIITATMPCGQFIYRDRAVEDEDWYYIRLKPLCKAYVEFSQLDIDSSVAETCFLFTEQELLFAARSKGGKSYFLDVMVNTRQQYTIAKFLAGEKSVIQDWRSSVLLRSGYGVKNTIRVSSSGGDISVYFNGSLGTTFRDTDSGGIPALSTGGYGYIVELAPDERLPSGYVEVAFSE